MLFTFCDLTSDPWLTYFDISLTLHVTYCLGLFAVLTNHGLINYIDTKAKFRHLKKLTCKGTLRQVFICLRPTPLLWPYLYPCTLYTCILYTYLHREGGRVGGELTREKVIGATDHKAGSKIQTWLTVSPVYQSINSDKNMPQSPVPLRVNFLRWQHFALVSVYIVD